ncbi:MAG: VCBS repeat-containing protein [Aequorivita sp.]|nr:VCBS repeat-containing protein [Aequorivita sp.]
MKKTTILLSLFFLGTTLIVAAQEQGKKAILNDDGTITIETVIMPKNESSTKGTQVFDRIWRFGRPAHPNFKNNRGVTLADLDNDGVDEILYGIVNTLYALEGDGSILWQKNVTGIITYPASVADMDGDGNLEIALNTRGTPSVGRVYLMDANGNDLPGWPLNFNDHSMFCSPAIGDVDDDGIMDIVTGEQSVSGTGYVHALKIDGTTINSNWPVDLGHIPSLTPSIADVDHDGSTDVVAAGYDTGMFIFNNQGQLFPNLPFDPPNVVYSYQSPILADLDGDEDLEIIGSNHGDSPRFFVMEHEGDYRSGWPRFPSSWTYSPPTVVDVDGDGVNEIFMSDRNVSTNGTPLPTIYGFDPDGNNLPNFPIDNFGGCEGVLSVADVNNDGVLEIIFSTNIIDTNEFGYIHAYSVDGSGEVDGFPLRPRGYTFMNGAVLGDVDDDGLLDLTANSYTLFSASGVDSTFVSVYNLNVPYDPASIKRNGYKGENTRDGYIEPEVVTGVSEFNTAPAIQIFPNPSEGMLVFKLPETILNANLKVYSVDGKVVFSEEGNLQTTNSYNLKHLNNGLYFVSIADGKKTYTAKWVKK